MELTNYHIKLSSLFNHFNDPEIILPEDYIKNKNEKKVPIKTIFCGKEITEYQPISGVQTKILNSLAYISGSQVNKNIYTLDNIYLYELALNLLNSHYKTYQEIINIMASDFLKTAKNTFIFNYKKQNF